ncbi:MAG: glycerophosphodiester phosphodiesterase [Ilumatobacteraceae bacterium]|jgi:glycerophosphoryl diester phosphodiesterase|nr:glycerophosphodiester phosphodiesterase [Acidimicrobiaceae bacterium]MBP6488376.1 glycerophosphodiester phosphodiesterase [Ilumatobacteraceae bacterium]MBP7889761.1 glycerophosphodiester phosphodiesterase [Ilumatobacteraceae bacterium]MBP8209304.1 glycerophosphodiester phosphodiesterase [Ilumatobacteraceae bacterium]
MGRLHPYLEWDGPIPFAHRGGASDVPENTMPAFQYAIDAGYRYVETDVQVTADGILVAFHDDDLSRTCGRPGRISDLPWSEVKTALVDGTAPIPLLEDMLGTWPELRVNIDCKTNTAEDALVTTLVRCAALDRVCVGAFSDRRMKRLTARLGDRLCTALSPGGVVALRFGRPRRPAANAAQVPVQQGPITVVNERFVRRAHALGIKVHVWTIDEPAEMHRLLDLGVDGIMTDKPQVLRGVFEQRGAWR